MDPKFLEELQKLKEQKNSDLDKIDLGQLSIPDFEDVEVPEDDFAAEAEAEISGGTIKFQRVSNAEPAKTQNPAGGRRGRKPQKPVIDEATKQRRKKITKVALISAASALAAVAILLTAFFGIRQANQKNYTYQYWGMGLGIDNGVNSYTFFGNLKEITQYGEIGQVQAAAEFKKGNCIRETVYTAEGDVAFYYAHEYDGNTRILSSYHENGQMVRSVKYTVTENGQIQAETTYYLEENRVETSLLTLSEDGNLQTADRVNELDGTLIREHYRGTLVTETVIQDAEDGVVSRTVYEYNNAKQLLTQTEYDGQNNIQNRTVNQYNEKNLLTKTLRYNGQGDVLNYDTYNYDLNNNPIKQVNYDGDGTMLDQILKVFNDKNRVTKETSLKADGSIIYCYGYDYDEKGYVSKSIIYNTENSTVIDRYTIYTRNQIGTIIESNTHNSSNILVEKAIYNDAGFQTELYKFTDSGVLTLEQKSKYDGKQRLTERTETVFTDSGDKISFFNEQYNDKGLVTVRIKENVEEETYEHYLLQYNDNGTKKQETMFDNAGKTVYDRIFDELERISAETLYDNGREATYNEYSYNDKNLITQKKSLDTITNTLTKTTYTYDNEGVLVSALDSDILNTPIVKREYDSDGLVSKQTNYDDDGDEADYYLFEFDEEDRVIVQESYNPDGVIMEKIVFYYRTDGGYDYTIYNELGIAIEDSRGPEFLPEAEEQPDTPPEDGYPTTNDEVIFLPTTDTPSNTDQSNSDSQTETNSTDHSGNTDSVTNSTGSESASADA